MEEEKLFQELLERISVATRFDYASSLLDWDQQTHMPEGGAEGRSLIFAAVKTEGFKIFTSDEIGEILRRLNKAEERLTPEKLILVHRMSAIYERLRAIPADLFESFNVAKSKAYAVWKKAKKQSDFESFIPALEEIVELTQKFAERYGYKLKPYDALLPDFEPGLTTDELTKIIEPLRRELVPFVHLLTEQPEKPDESLLQGHFPQDLQEKVSREVLYLMNYDFDRGRLDPTVHPFTTSVGPDDVRVTTRFSPWRISHSIFPTMHEGGHALYEQGKDPLLKWLYLDKGISMGIHESQSRMWENMVGRSFAFWQFFYLKLMDIFPYYRNVAFNDFYRAINAVKPSLIRVNADEVTYNLHIMLRAELETGLIAGEIKVKELPEIWNAKMEEYLGVVPKNDAEGVLQDVHWSSGYFGYFPSYMLGNLYAAQLFATAKKEISNLEEQIAKGNLRVLLEWLRPKVHRFGLIYEAPQLLREVTGEGPNPQYWLKYVKEKFSPIYGLS
jgi:carboxypeptidase Taq